MALSPGPSGAPLNWDSQFQVRTTRPDRLQISRRKYRQPGSPTVARLVDMSDDMIRFAVMMHVADGHYPPQGRKAHVVVRKGKRRACMVLQTLASDTSAHLSPTPGQTRTVGRMCRRRFWQNRFESCWNGGRRWHPTARHLDEIQHWRTVLQWLWRATPFQRVQGRCGFHSICAHATGLRATLTVKSHPDKPAWRPTYIVQI